MGADFRRVVEFYACKQNLNASSFFKRDRTTPTSVKLTGSNLV